MKKPPERRGVRSGRLAPPRPASTFHIKEASTPEPLREGSRYTWLWGHVWSGGAWGGAIVKGIWSIRLVVGRRESPGQTSGPGQPPTREARPVPPAGWKLGSRLPARRLRGLGTRAVGRGEDAGGAPGAHPAFVLVFVSGDGWSTASLDPQAPCSSPTPAAFVHTRPSRAPASCTPAPRTHIVCKCPSNFCL